VQSKCITQSGLQKKEQIAARQSNPNRHPAQSQRPKAKRSALCGEEKRKKVKTKKGDHDVYQNLLSPTKIREFLREREKRLALFDPGRF
jgi:hypothetical protein